MLTEIVHYSLFTFHYSLFWHFSCMLSCESRKAITKIDNMFNPLKIELGGKDYDASNEK